MSGAEMEEPDEEEYGLMMELEQLETIKEEMEELGVSSLAEVEARMKDLNQKLDELHHRNGDR
ncbi:MAG: hypothetical protein M1380_04780 [Chloroflexi bacterium]|nr:hypothetical protein [Chloroflexota bacterium]